MNQLTTKRLILVPFSAEDFNLLSSLFRDPHIREFLWDDEVIPDEVVQEVLEKNVAYFAKENWGLWQIRLKDGKVIGFAGFWPFFDEPQPQLLYGLWSDFTGMGYATEAAGEVISYGFQKLGFRYVDASMDKPHQISQKVAERLGMKFLKETLEDGKPTVFYRIEAD